MLEVCYLVVVATSTSFFLTRHITIPGIALVEVGRNQGTFAPVTKPLKVHVLRIPWY
jgi:hypothetical protein